MHKSHEPTPVSATYLAECYWPGVTRTALTEAIGRAHAAAEQITRSGRGIRLVRSTFVPADEAVLSLFQAVSPEAVRDATEQAGFPADRISVAEDFPP